MPLPRIHEIKDFRWGLIDTLEDKSLPAGASSRELNWLTKVDLIELRRGYAVFGNETAGTGKITSLFVAKMSKGTEIPFRTRGKKLEYYNSTTETWTEIGTDVLGTDSNGKQISFAEYHSQAGDQLFINSPTGPYLKIMMANPGSYADLYDATKNHKGYLKIKQNRTFLWGRIKDTTGFYLSKIDVGTYTTVSAENIGTGNGTTKTFAATLAFKAGGAKRTCFGISVTDGTETFTDNYDDTLTGSLGGTGTINYMSGAISVTFNTAPANTQAITCGYQWEDSNVGGISDFTYSTPRTAGQGDIIRQDDGGDIKSISSYGETEYCFHEKKNWALTLSADDTKATNFIYRQNVGIPNRLAEVETGFGIFYVDALNEKDQHLRVLTLAENSDQVIPISISQAMKYQNKTVGIDLTDYAFDEAAMVEWGDYILCACKTSDSAVNNRVILYHKIQKTLDVLEYFVTQFAIYNGTLIAGDPQTDNVYTLFSGFDDDDSLISNYWEGDNGNIGFDGLKKVKKLIIEGLISPTQIVKVYADLDNSGYAEIGEIRGDGTYVDKGTGVLVGSNTIGSKIIGGGGTGVSAYNFIRKISWNSDKFNLEKLKFVAQEVGYVAISKIKFYDIRLKSKKLAIKYR